MATLQSLRRAPCANFAGRRSPRAIEILLAGQFPRIPFMRTRRWRNRDREKRCIMTPLWLMNEKPKSHFRVPDSVRIFALFDRGAVTTTCVLRRSIPCSRRVHVTHGPGLVFHTASKRWEREAFYKHLVDFSRESCLLLEHCLLVSGIAGKGQAWAEIISDSPVPSPDKSSFRKLTNY